MFTAEQYRAKAAEYKTLLDDPRSPGETKEFLQLEKTYTTLADNEEWLARNADKVMPAAPPVSQYDIVPASENDQDKRAIVEEHEHVLRCLGAAVAALWSTLPAKVQRELFDYASSRDDFARDSSLGDVEQTARLKGRIARFLHDHHGERTQ